MTVHEPQKSHFRFCKGCKFEKDKDCPNPYTEDCSHHKDGTRQMGYCMYYEK